jgi:hypothetical protein
MSFCPRAKIAMISVDEILLNVEAPSLGGEQNMIIGDDAKVRR